MENNSDNTIQESSPLTDQELMDGIDDQMYALDIAKKYNDYTTIKSENELLNEYNRELWNALNIFRKNVNEIMSRSVDNPISLADLSRLNIQIDESRKVLSKYPKQ